MRISELERRLAEIRARHGDLEVIGGTLADDRGPSRILVLGKDGCELADGGEPDGVFIE